MCSIQTNPAFQVHVHIGNEKLGVFYRIFSWFKTLQIRLLHKFVRLSFCGLPIRWQTKIGFAGLGCHVFLPLQCQGVNAFVHFGPLRSHVPNLRWQKRKKEKRNRKQRWIHCVSYDPENKRPSRSPGARVPIQWGKLGFSINHTGRNCWELLQ